MPGLSSTLGSADEGLCRIYGLSDSLTNVERRAQERHERRLARIVADQWMHVARKRLILAWCAQMVHCWRKICSQNRWTRQQIYLAAEHCTRKKFLKAFNAFREGSRMKRRNQSAAAEFHKKALEKKTFRGLIEAQLDHYRQRLEQHCLAKAAFQAVKRYREKKKAAKKLYSGAQKFYGTSLMRQALSGFSNHRDYLKSREAAASNHWKKSMRCRILRRWGAIANRIANLREQGIKSRILLLEALLKRCMKTWLMMTRQIVKARQGEIAQTRKFTNSRKKRMLQAWAQLNREKQSRRLKLEQATMMHSDHISAAVTNAWRNYVKEKERSRARLSMAFSFRRQQALTEAIVVWKAYKAHKERTAAVTLKALAHFKKKMTQKSMAAWRPWQERRTSKQQETEKALLVYNSQLQRWTCECILAAGQVQSRVGRQSMSSTMRVAPYARKPWRFLSQRHSNLRKAFLHQKQVEGSSKALQKVEMPLSFNQEPGFMHEVMLRIGIDKDGLKIQPERPCHLHMKWQRQTKDLK